MNKKNKNYDLLIIGGGPAGLSAAIYAGRRNLKIGIISIDVGGQMNMTNEIENYPGFEFTSGFDLALKFKQQASKWGTDFIFDEVKKIRRNRDGFLIKTSKSEYKSRAVILAFGLAPRKLEVPGEEKFIGKGVTYCATCDGPLYKGKTVAVVGGGNSAFEAADYLSKIAQKVYLIHFSENFQAEAYLVNRLKKQRNIEFCCCSKIEEIKGDKKLKSVVATDVKGKGEKIEIEINGLFVEIGYQAKTNWIKGLVDVNERGEIIISRDNETSEKGIFAAGDCSDIMYKQIIISAGEGAKAALQAYKYISKNTATVLRADWGECKIKK